MFRRRSLPVVLVCGLWLGCGSKPFPADQLRAFIEYQVADKQLPAVSIAVVDDQETIFSEGFGEASADSVYRVGSVSKLYTDIAVMRLVEQGLLDLDAPVADALPAFHPQNDFPQDITLRHLMAHRSGLVREPPVGSYFDASEPSIAAIVESLKATRAILEPGSKTKYSNAALVVVGGVVEAAAGKPFADHMREQILAPLGMTSSSYGRLPALEARIPKALMWTYDREFPAPTFDVLVPAGNLYSSMPDQARLLQAIFRRGAPLLEPETFAKMLEPQFDPQARFGLGFAMGTFQGHKRIGHGGAVYGFSTELAALPDEKIGVVAAASRDFTNDVVGRIANRALELTLAWKAGEEIPPWTPPQPVDAATRQAAAGLYASESGTVRLVDRDGELWSEGIPYHRVLIRRDGEGFVTDGRLTSGTPVTIEDSAVTIGETRYQRVPDDEPPAAKEAWGELIGEYGFDHNILFILERQGRLCALVEWLPMYPLVERGPDDWAFPDFGLYHDEQIRFRRDSSGRVTAAVMAGIEFPRRPGAEDGRTFRIEPLKPIAELRAIADAAEPPARPEGLLEPDLVDLAPLDPTLRFDIRYATTNNFMGERFYPVARARMQRPAAEALVRAHLRLRPRGYGILVHDAYRPWRVTKMFWEATPEAMRDFVANPANGSIHNRGAAADISLYDLQTGKPALLPSGYDEFSSRAFPEYPGGTSRRRWLRELLRAAMEAEGFSVYPYEWWHFNYADAEKYPILNEPLTAP
ncbi:MAG: serine hydrolase [Acidobacteria bacterium]|nr:serine hydrolase [Acidobacteriota bacterium]